jgi:hypothetical protein
LKNLFAVIAVEGNAALAFANDPGAWLERQKPRLKENPSGYR